jgi:hypothetical protein
VAWYAANVIATMLPSAVVVLLITRGVALQAYVGDPLWRLILEGAYFRYVSAALDVLFAGAVARFAAYGTTFPACHSSQLRVNGPWEVGKLVGVASLASVASDVVRRIMPLCWRHGRFLAASFNSYRQRARTEIESAQQEQRKKQHPLDCVRGLHHFSSNSLLRAAYGELIEFRTSLFHGRRWETQCLAQQEAVSVIAVESISLVGRGVLVFPRLQAIGVKFLIQEAPFT